MILGAGFAGVRVALDLLRSGEKVKITLVNDSPFHCFHADLYEVVSTPLRHENVLSFEQLLGTVNIPLTEIFPHGVEILIDKVEAVDLDLKKVILQRSGEMVYDYLVLALGSDTSYFNIPGAQDHSHPLKNAEDALNIHNDLEELMAQGKIKIAIAGGGFTGVELAGNLVDFVKDRASVRIIEGSDHLLGGMPGWAQVEALNRLKNLGVEVNLSSIISLVSERKLQVKDQGEIEFDYLIWTAGVKGRGLSGWIKGVNFSNKEQIITQSDLSVENYPEVWVAGDQAGVDKVPQAAWAALEEAKVVSFNMLAMLRGTAKRQFKIKEIAFDVPVGESYAISNKGHMRLKGWFGWVVKRFSALDYFLSILPRGKAIRLWIKGVEFYPR